MAHTSLTDWSEIRANQQLNDRHKHPLSDQMVKDGIKSVPPPFRVAEFQTDSSIQSINYKVLSGNLGIPQSNSAASLARLLSSHSISKENGLPMPRALDFITSTDRKRLCFEHAPTVAAMTSNFKSFLANGTESNRSGSLVLSAPVKETFATEPAADPEDKRGALVSLLMDLSSIKHADSKKSSPKKKDKEESSLNTTSLWLTDFRTRSDMIKNDIEGIADLPSDALIVNFITEINGVPRVLKKVVPRELWSNN